MFEVLLALIVMPTLGWRWLLGLSAVPLLVFSFCCAVSYWKVLFLPKLKFVEQILAHQIRILGKRAAYNVIIPKL